MFWSATKLDRLGRDAIDVIDAGTTVAKLEKIGVFVLALPSMAATYGALRAM